MKYISDAQNAPKAIGPYSQVVVANGWAFLSGQVPLDPATGDMVKGGITEQTTQVLKNLKAVLTHIDRDFSHVVSSTIYLTDLGNFQEVNKLYEQALAGVKPARATVQVSALPKCALV